MKKLNTIMLIVITALSSCRTAKQTSPTYSDNQIEITFVQVNDVYEIAPLAGGKEGGMARVAALKKKVLKDNPNTFLVMAGDFVSPSVYNSLQYEGKRIRGRQMVDAMNAAGTDLVVFGNHEFDITENELQERINESGFQWIASNAFHKRQNGAIEPFGKTNVSNSKPFPKSFTMKVKDADGTYATIGFFGLTLPFNKADYVSYTDPISTATLLYNQLKDSVDAVVAITHQSVEDDIALAKALPNLALIIGGHEHNMKYEKIGNVYITKAHANARSAYVIKLHINKKNGKVAVTPKLEYLTDKIAFDSNTNVVVNKWVDIANRNYASLGFDVKQIVVANGQPLDGRESEVRSRPTNLTRIITAAMANAAPMANVVIVNSGSIRVDDMLQPPVSQYDILRTMPFGGGIREAEIKGSLLIKVLEAGNKNAGIGGYLLYSDALRKNDSMWMLNNNPVDAGKTYRVAVSDFLFTGKEANLDFFSPANPDVVKVYPAETSVTNPLSDIRLAIIRYLNKQK